MIKTKQQTYTKNSIARQKSFHKKSLQIETQNQNGSIQTTNQTTKESLGSSPKYIFISPNTSMSSPVNKNNSNLKSTNQVDQRQSIQKYVNSQYCSKNKQITQNKSPSTVINKYYKNFGQSKANQGFMFENTQKQYQLRKKKDLTITFQKEKSETTQENNQKNVFSDEDQKLRESSQEQDYYKTNNNSITQKQISQQNSVQSSGVHTRTQSCQVLPLVSSQNQNVTKQNTFFTSQVQQSCSSNKIQAMTCILKGFQHLNKSEFCQQMQKQVLNRQVSSPNFFQNKIFDFQTVQEQQNWVSKQKDSRKESVPYFPENNDENNTTHNFGQNQESLFKVNDVSSVKTVVESFAGKDESVQFSDIYPQMLLRKNSQLTNSCCDESLLKNLQPATRYTGGQDCTQQQETTFFSQNSVNFDEELHSQKDVKNFKEVYFKFGIWPELDFVKQQILKKEYKQLNQSNKEFKQELDQLSKTNLQLQVALQKIQNQQQNNEQKQNCLQRDTCFSNKKQNKRYQLNHTNSQNSIPGQYAISGFGGGVTYQRSSCHQNSNSQQYSNNENHQKRVNIQETQGFNNSISIEDIKEAIKLIALEKNRSCYQGTNKSYRDQTEQQRVLQTALDMSNKLIGKLQQSEQGLSQQ